MTKVLYGSKTSAWLAGEFFPDGVKDFADNDEGIRFAKMFNLMYLVIDDQPKE